MKKSLILIAPALMLSAPLVAADRPATNTGHAVDTRADRPAVVDRHQPPENHPNWRRINHKINKRAKNAIENGADPQTVRRKAQAYKKKLHRRWKASQ